jgi:zinc/manganese transport system permease protein
MNFDALSLSILGPAFLAGLLVLATHVPLGIQVLNRGIVFIDLALAQIAGLGVILADMMGYEPTGFAVQVSAVAAAVLGSMLLTYTEKKWPEIQEALIGTLFALGATGAVLLLANNPHGGEHLRDMLVGQILWVNGNQITLTGIVTFVLLIGIFAFRALTARLGFYLVFAFAVTASVQMVGIYLVFASLIIPALATRYFAQRRLVAAYGTGAAGYGLGLIISALFDLPSGAVIVWTLALTGLAVHMAGPSKPAFHQ